MQKSNNFPTSPEALNHIMYYRVFKEHLIDPIGRTFHEPQYVLRPTFERVNAGSACYHIASHLQGILYQYEERMQHHAR